MSFFGDESSFNVSDLEFKIREYFNLSGSIYYQSSQRMINDEDNYQEVQPGYYLIDIGFKDKWLPKTVEEIRPLSDKPLEDFILPNSTHYDLK